MILIFALLLNLPILIQADGLKGYIYYEDAKCVDKKTIYGTLNFAYNDRSLTSEGFSKKNFKGPCKYFDGGHFDFIYSDKSSSKGTFMKSGYCIKCNGVTGCTKTKNDCNDFQTILPEYPYYSGNQQQSSNRYGSASTTSTGSSSGSLEEKIESSIYQEISRASDSSFSTYLFLGILMGMMSLLVLLTRASTKMFFSGRRQAASVDLNEFLDGYNDTDTDTDSDMRAEKGVVV